MNGHNKYGLNKTGVKTRKLHNGSDASVTVRAQVRVKKVQGSNKAKTGAELWFSSSKVTQIRGLRVRPSRQYKPS